MVKLVNLFDQRGGGGGSQTAGGFAGFTDALDGDSLAGGQQVDC